MTGMLAAIGVALVLVASAYAGINASDSDVLTPGVEITPVSDLGRETPTEPSPTPTAEAEAPPPEPTAAPVTNRQDCNQIRGTQYVSEEERTWYLANCVR